MAQATKLVHTRIGDTDVWVSAVQTPGTQQTAGSAADRLVDAFDKARDVMVELGGKVADAVETMAARGAHPDEVSVEFGLSISTEGSIIFAAASAEASLAVTVTYKRPEPDNHA
ncbi:MAG: CU044_2847 family protein [Dermatophilaceae bacterium]